MIGFIVPVSLTVCLTVVSGAAQRNIPPELIYKRGELPSTFEEGTVFLVDKPNGYTSFEVVEAIRKGTGVGKVGHAGTLDPQATGLLLLLVARPATRLQEAFMDLSKRYEGTMRLGERTPSHDAETEVVEKNEVGSLSLQEIETAGDLFTGSLEQVPPMYSAVKIDGERLYKKARRGETVDRPPRQVHVDVFKLIDWSPPDLTFSVSCSKGTYIRSLARDLGVELGVGAHLTALRRTEIGSYSVDNAWSLHSLEQALSQT